MSTTNTPTPLRLAINSRMEQATDFIERPIVDGNLLVGLTIEEAQRRYPGISITPTNIDGQSQTILYIYDIHRHLVHIDNGVISEFVEHS